LSTRTRPRKESPNQFFAACCNSSVQAPLQAIFLLAATSSVLA
jgi:hypothetical protein